MSLPKPSGTELSKEEFADWLLHPVTQSLRFVLAKRVEEIKNQWMHGSFTAETEFGTKFLNGQANGVAKAFEEILSIDETILNGEMKDE